MNTERSSTGNNRNFTVSSEARPEPSAIALLLFLFFSLSLLHPPSLSHILPHNGVGSHRSGELLMRIDF